MTTDFTGTIVSVVSSPELGTFTMDVTGGGSQPFLIWGQNYDGTITVPLDNIRLTFLIMLSSACATGLPVTVTIQELFVADFVTAVKVTGKTGSPGALTASGS